MERGTLVLTLFPFTDLSSSKRRPAVIVSKVEKSKKDVIVAFISSVIPAKAEATDFILEVTHPDFTITGLKKKSIFKMDKLVTLQTNIFTGEIGSISKSIMAELETRLKLALDLKN